MMMSLYTMEDLEEVEADANNNGGKEKYSLRPRSLRQKTEKGLEMKKEIFTRCKKNSDKNRAKQKPPPLSRYRRKTANARERNRMREINVAFETLRRAVPQINSTEIQTGNEKLTKITTLRLAMKYIQALRQVLDAEHSAESHLNLANLLCDETELDILLSDGESLQFQSDMSESFASPDHPLTSPFSDPSEAYTASSPGFSESPEFPFHEPVMSSSFHFDETLSGPDFCDDFLTSQCVGLS